MNYACVCVYGVAVLSALKPGQCPVVSWSGVASVADVECVVECGRDSDCTGVAKCCDLGCNRTCAQPMHSQLPSTAPYTSATFSLNVFHSHVQRSR